MSEFKRGIENCGFITALNELYKDENSFWHKMVKDPDLFIAIRDEYVSVYYRGNSICELRFKNSEIIGKTHYKYLLHPDLNEYAESVGGKFSENNLLKRFITSLNDLNAIKKSSKIYSGVEKTGVHSISINEKNVLDVEITFSDLYNKTERMDYLKLEDNKEDLNLVFYEAKHFSNPEIRAKNGDAKVLTQIKEYEKVLKNHQDEIIKSYQQVCKNLQKLDLIKHKEVSYLDKVANGEISIDFKPRLVIFGFDQDQKDGDNWKEHHRKLWEVLNDRLKLRGKVN